MQKDNKAVESYQVMSVKLVLECLSWEFVAVMCVGGYLLTFDSQVPRSERLLW